MEAQLVCIIAAVRALARPMNSKYDSTALTVGQRRWLCTQGRQELPSFERSQLMKKGRVHCKRELWLSGLLGLNLGRATLA